MNETEKKYAFLAMYKACKDTMDKIENELDTYLVNGVTDEFNRLLCELVKQIDVIRSM